MSELHARVAVVTGAASGIGKATTARLLADGWHVVAADMNQESLGRLEADLHANADRLAVIATDVSVEADVQAAVALSGSRFGGCTAVVNNAGVGGAFGAITELDAGDWDYTFAVLARGVFFGVKHGARAIRACGTGGSIVNLGSVAAFHAGGGPSVYSAAKAAVVNLTQTAAIELAADRIRVNAVCPGVIDTPLLRAGRGDHVDETPPQPWPSWGQPEDVAATIAFLVNDDSQFITGQSVVVDGGLMAAGPGQEFSKRMGIDARHLGVVGVNRGNSGKKSEVRSISVKSD